MKKVILFFALAITCVTGAFAQKQTGGEKNFEVQFTPLGTSPVGMNGLRFRYFTSESMAIRVGITLANQMDKTVNAQESTVTGSDGKDVVLPALYDIDRNKGFAIHFGAEKHMAGTDRLSPYIGGEVFFGRQTQILEREFYSANNADDVAKPEKYSTFTGIRTDKSNTIGVGLVAGTDYYFVDNFYIGVEIGFGFQHTKYKDQETEISNVDNYKYSSDDTAGVFGLTAAQTDGDFDQAHMNDDNTAIEYNTISGDGDGNFISNKFGTTFQSTLRLGWIFN